MTYDAWKTTPPVVDDAPEASCDGRCPESEPCSEECAHEWQLAAERRRAARVTRIAKRRCMWVTADGNAASLSTVVRSTHRSLTAAERAAAKAGRGREVVSARVMALMQAGRSFTDATIAVAWSDVEPAVVEVTGGNGTEGRGSSSK